MEIYLSTGSDFIKIGTPVQHLPSLRHLSFERKCGHFAVKERFERNGDQHIFKENSGIHAFPTLERWESLDGVF